MTPTQPKKTVLVVEDNTIIREGLVAVLGRAGFAVISAANGQEGLDRLRDSPRSDLILLDVFMPVMDGWEFLRRLGSDRQAFATPVVVMAEDAISTEWARAHGCVGHLRKPFDMGELVSEIRRCLP